jgi:hypothetical protein
MHEVTEGFGENAMTHWVPDEAPAPAPSPYLGITNPNFNLDANGSPISLTNGKWVQYGDGSWTFDESAGGYGSGGLWKGLGDTIVKSVLDTPGPISMLKAIDEGKSWNPYGGDASVWDYGAGRVLAEDPNARDIGRTIGTIALGATALGALGGEAAGAGEGAISQFPSSLGAAIPDVAPIAAGPGVISDFPALLPSLGALPEVGGGPGVSDVIDVVRKRPPVEGVGQFPPVIAPPLPTDSASIPSGPGPVDPAPDLAPVPAPLPPVPGAGPNYSKLLSSLLKNALGVGGGAGGGAGSGSGGAGGYQPGLSTSLRQHVSAPVTTTNPNGPR